MKKIFCFLLLVTILATLFNGLLNEIRTSIAFDDTPTTLLDCITPVIAYADSDTMFTPGTLPPPPPPLE